MPEKRVPHFKAGKERRERVDIGAHAGHYKGNGASPVAEDDAPILEGSLGL